MLLELKGIQKKFGEAEVLKGVSFGLEQGKILGLVGENGAGKSTLMNILAGIHRPSAGEMMLNGQAFSPQTPSDSLAEGIAIIHQELNLFPNLSVTENIFLHNFPKKKVAGISFIDSKEAIEQTSQLLRQVGLSVAPQTKVEQLSRAQQQLVEIGKALSTSPRMIIFDEPTTSLTRHETQKLFELISQLKQQNIAMIYISHNLEDVMHLTDNIVVLRDGALINTYHREDGFMIRDIVNDMVGRDMTQYFPDRKTQPEKEILLEVKNLQMPGISMPGMAHDISFKVKKKEVLGFYGLVGAGRSEMARMIYGLDPFQEGDIIWKGEKVKTPSPARWIQKNVAFLTEDRREEGLLLDDNIESNISLAALPAFARSPLQWIDFTAINSVAQKHAEATKIKYQSLTRQLATTLSGGNQQKVVLAKWLLIDPELLILDEPTKGIDIGAKHNIYSLINEFVEKGASVILISSEIEELLGMCDRILVMNQGSISAEFSKMQFDRTEILKSALHAEKQKENY